MLAAQNNKYGALAVRFIDWLFGLFGQKDHCKNADEGNEAQYEVWG